MKSRYSTDEFVEIVSRSLKQYLDSIFGPEYNKDAHIEDLLVSTESFISSSTIFIGNIPSK